MPVSVSHDSNSQIATAISISIPVDGISRILIFQTREEFEGTLLENPQLVPLMGYKDMHRLYFPVYIAGFKDKVDSEENPREDS